jgi:magnesium-transporting ATPase (P-type)
VQCKVKAIYCCDCCISSCKSMLLTTSRCAYVTLLCCISYTTFADFVYQAESPDEGALVDAARDLGYVTFYSYTIHSFKMLRLFELRFVQAAL